MKKSAINNKPKLTRQIAWFIGIYLASILLFGLFHGLERVLINFLK